MAKIEGFTVEKMIANFKGTLNNQFAVEMTFPGTMRGLITNSTKAEDDFVFHCKATALPASTIGEYRLPFRGKEIPLAGDKTFSDWNVTILNDREFIIRNAFEQWNDLIVGNSLGDSGLEAASLVDYSGTGLVHQIDRNSNILKTYRMLYAWPSEIGQMSLSTDSTNSYGEFDVTFKMVNWESNTTRNNSDGAAFFA